MIMIEAGGDEIPGRRTIERAIEESLAMKIKRVLKSGGSESKVVATERTDDSIRNWEQGETRRLVGVLSSTKAGSDSMAAIEEEFRVENYQQNGLQGCKEENGSIDIRVGNHVDCCVGETSGGADSNRVQMLQRSPKHPTLRDLMVLQDEDTDETSSRSATAVDNNQAINFCLDASPRTNGQPSTEEATPRVAEKLNLEKQDSELESYILDKLSLLQPSFRTLFEPMSVAAGTISTGSSDNKTRQEAAAAKSKWKKKIEDVVGKVYKKQKQQAPDLETILYETDVKGILKMKWEEEREKSQGQQRTRWPRSCICCPRSYCPSSNLKDWELQLEEYSFAW